MALYRKIITAVLFCISFAALAYPTISSSWNIYRNNRLITEYDEAGSLLPANENERILKEAAEYNDQHTVNTVVDVMTDDSYTLSHPYDAILNPSGNGVMGYLEIPKIAQSLNLWTKE